MQGFAWFFIVCGLCYLLLLGTEYSKYVKGENWTPVEGEIIDSINGLPLTRFEPNRLNTLATVANWSYVKYKYTIGEGIYENTEEMAPHLTLFDYIIGPMAVRYGPGAPIALLYNPLEPKESTFGFEVFRPIENLGGTACVFFGIGFVLLYVNNVVNTANDDSSNLDLAGPSLFDRR